jgi:SAM-dependent methyltransferase
LKKDAAGKKTLALDVEELRRRLGPVKVALIDQWIREVNGPYNALIAQHIHPQALVLDIGCSRGDPDLPAMQQARLCVGADLDLPGLRANNIDDAVVMAPMGALPFPDATFDVVVCKWVAEHLEHPAKEFGEASRVLKPGGALVMLTPNALSFFTIISRALPYRLKQIFKGRLFANHEEDTFRTYYRANTIGSLNAKMALAGLRPALVDHLPGMYTFFIFNGPLAWTVRRLEQWQHAVPPLRRFGTYIYGAWVKPAA